MKMIRSNPRPSYLDPDIFLLFSYVDRTFRAHELVWLGACEPQPEKLRLGQQPRVQNWAAPTLQLLQQKLLFAVSVFQLELLEQRLPLLGLQYLLLVLVPLQKSLCQLQQECHHNWLNQTRNLPAKTLKLELTRSTSSDVLRRDPLERRERYK